MAKKNRATNWRSQQVKPQPPDDAGVRLIKLIYPETQEDKEAAVKSLMVDYAADPALRERVKQVCGVEIEIRPDGFFAVVSDGDHSTALIAALRLTQEERMTAMREGKFMRCAARSFLDVMFEKPFAECSAAERQQGTGMLLTLYVMDKLQTNSITLEERNEYIMAHRAETNEYMRVRWGFTEMDAIALVN